MKFALISSLFLAIQSVRFVPDGVFEAQEIEGALPTAEQKVANNNLPFDRRSVRNALQNLIYAKNVEVQIGLVLFIAIHQFRSSKRFCFLSWCEGKVYGVEDRKQFYTVANWFVEPVKSGNAIAESMGSVATTD